MSRTLHLFGTDWGAMMVPIQVIRWYRMQCYDGTDSCAIVVPIRRYCHIIGKLNEKDSVLLKKNHIQYENKCNLTDEEILNEYIECDFVNFPSLHEGFGMPIIEGQSIGRPVLTSDVSPMREIAGEGAILVNPESIEDIRQGYKKIFQHPEVLVGKGLDNVKRFRLNIIVQQYLDIYKKIITR